MSFWYRKVLRPVLFRQESEDAHNRTLKMLGWVSRNRMMCGMVGAKCRRPELPVQVMGLTFPNPLGLAAGMDKQAAAVPAWEALGFGFSELGGVTWHAQPGNPQPRMFRLVSDKAVINRMGFNNPGAEAMAARLAAWRSQGRWPGHPVGVNLGKSKITPLQESASDYARSFEVLRPYADFFVVNVSSPNTPNLRQLQDRAALDEILAALQAINKSGTPKPLLVKVAPDLSLDALDEVLAVAKDRELSGIVATNTTISRPAASNPASQRAYSETGGLSGRPLTTRSTEIVRHIYRQTDGTLPIIGVGGIFNSADAWEKITAGASLVQVYTGLVYEGPGLVREIVEGLRTRLRANGFSNLAAAVGSGAR